LAPDARRAVIAAGRAQQREGCTLQPAVFVEDVDFRTDLIDDDEGQALIILGCDHPIRDPAGRFVAKLGRDFTHDVLWIDYGKALSLHRVVHGNPGDHRLQRLATSSTSDKRISYGCINVPVKFYDDVVLGTFTGTAGIVYILPEVKTIRQVFPGITGA
jgi:hypothetical protein